MTIQDIEGQIEADRSLQFVMETGDPEILGTIYLAKVSPTIFIMSDIEDRANLINRSKAAISENRRLYCISLIHTPKQLIVTREPRFEEGYRVVSLHLLDTVREMVDTLTALGFDPENLILWEDVLSEDIEWQPFPPNPVRRRS